MKWSYSLGRVAGIEVRIHATFFLLLAFYGFLHFEQGGWDAARSGMAFILLLFLCVLLHEFGHALAARAFGIHTPDITLLPIGGVARLARMPRDPFQELIIAIAGPAVNVLIALILFLAIGRFVDWQDMLSVAEGSPSEFLLRLLAVNVWLVIFNCLPAFPMDGGRILRALLAMVMPHDRATAYAGRVGQIMAALFGVWGLVSGNFILLLIAVFVFMGAQQEINASKFLGALPRGARLHEVMATHFTTLPAELRFEQILPVLWQSAQPVFPVADTAMRPHGLIYREKALRQADAWAREPVASICQKALLLDQSLDLTAAFDQMQEASQPIALVTNAQGQLVGLLWPELVRQRFASQ
jgi:Zn-dependent protease